MTELIDIPEPVVSLPEEKKRHSRRRLRRRCASLRRRQVRAIRHRYWQRGSSNHTYDVMDGIRHPTRQELRHDADWMEAQSNIGWS